ncbi:MAG TPA: hypothetical protein VN258_00085, partial [Mobilitalea sp.]|nr:hypothetical protein [Mobilitalea sp.]
SPGMNDKNKGSQEVSNVSDKASINGSADSNAYNRSSNGRIRGYVSGDPTRSSSAHKFTKDNPTQP